MPRKKSVSESEKASIQDDRGKESPVNIDSAQDSSLSEPSTAKNKTVGKLDSLDFYKTQLKLEGLESDLAKKDKKASEINSEILEIVKQESDLVERLENNPESPDIASYEGDLAKAQERIQDLYKRLENTRAEKDALNHEVTQLRDDLTRSYHESRKADQLSDQSYGVIIRTSDDTFMSTLFRDGKYDVRLAKDGSYIKFKRDVEGLAVCVNGTIRIPMLPTYIPYKGTREFGAIPINGNTVMIRL